MNFEDMMKLLVVVGTATFLVIMAGLAVKLLLLRPRRAPSSPDAEQLDGLEDRLQRTEAKVGELEERLDFTERMLAEARKRVQLPGS